MLTIEIRLNGDKIATAELANVSDLADLSDYALSWEEREEIDLNIPWDSGEMKIEGHRRRQTVWALVAKAAAAILGQKTARKEFKG
jgi:hypothetical protein